MLSRTEAVEIVTKKLGERSSPDNPFVVVEKDTIEKSFGWVLFYNSKKYLETGIRRYALAGNGPVIVNKHNGSVEFCGSARSPSEIIAEYEKQLFERSKSIGQAEKGTGTFSDEGRP